MSCHPATMSWEAAPVCSTVICFASLVGLPCSLVRGDLMEVCPLSRGVMSLGGSTPISSITEEPSLFPYSFTHTSMGLPCGALSLAGEIWAYPVSSQCQSGLGPSLFARSFPVHDRRGSTSCTSSFPLFWVSLSAPLAYSTSRRLSGFRICCPYHSILAPNRFDASRTIVLSRFR